MSDAPRLAVVLPYISDEGGGVTEIARLLVAGLARRGGYQIEVLAFASQQDEAARALWPPAEAGVSVRTFKAHGPRSYSFAPALARHLARNRFDLIHLHGLWMFHIAAALLPMQRGTACIVSPHGMLESWILRRSPRLKATVSWLYQRRFLSRATVVHALTAKERQDILDYQPRAKTEIVPNFSPPFGVNLLTPKWSSAVPTDQRVFLFLGRIHEKKGWRALLEAWDQCCLADSSFRTSSTLVFCGWPDDAPDFVRLVAESRQRLGNVLYAGPQFGYDKQASFLRADVFLLPSQSEGLPMVVLEAIRGGTLVLISRACNLPDFLDQGLALDTGTSARTISQALIRAHNLAAAEAETMRKKAVNLLEKSYSEALVLERFEAIYSGAIAASQDPQPRSASRA